MPKVDFPSIPDPEGFQPLPPARYLVKLEEVKEETSRNGNEMWNLRFVVQEGEYEGRYVFDRMVFTEKAMDRVKLICSRLGIDTSGPVDLTPSMLEGRRCYLDVLVEEYLDETNEPQKRNTVPYAGYHEVQEEGQAIGAGVGHDDPPPVTDDDVPF